MKLPAFTTFTGVDVHTDIDRLQNLSRRFDVEWGVLISEKWSGAEGALRYPQIDWIQNLYNKGLNLSLHVCNGLACDFVDVTGRPTVASVVDLQQFQRVQINHHVTMSQLAGAVHNFHGSVIAQLFNSKTIRKIEPRVGLGGRAHRVHLLWDGSGGAGVLPGYWPELEDDCFHNTIYGWAGGLGPDTVPDHLPLIAKAAQHPKMDAWYIDMESWVRRRDNDHFDLDACEKVLEQVKSFKEQQECTT
jgi:hypothetical protein